MKKIDLNQFERQISIKEIGEEGQKKIRSSKVLIVGLGGLGSTVATFLIRMGIGTIGVIDDDDVDITNLQRQILYDKYDIGKNKINRGVRKLRRMNSNSKVIGLKGKVDEHNVNKLVNEYDLIVDCTDNYTVRGLINRACIENKKTCVYGSVSNFEGYMTVLLEGRTPCYECLMGDLNKLKELDKTGGKVGVLGATVGIIASMQATEVIKVILGVGEIAEGKLIMVNSLNMTIEIIKYSKRKDCFCNNGARKIS